MFRCYDGQWDSKALALFAEQDRLLKLIREREPEAHCTYFPSPGFFVVHVWGRTLGPERTSKLEALSEALAKLPGMPCDRCPVLITASGHLCEDCGKNV